MRTWIVVLVVLLMAGCSGDSFRVSTAIEGTPAPHAGYNFGPDSYVQAGDEVKVTGVIVWIEGLDPNDIVDDL